MKMEQLEFFGEKTRRLLNDYQHDFPLSSRPYREIASDLGVSEQEIIDELKTLSDQGYISRVGPVFRPNRIGVSTLASMEIPEERLEEVADIVSRYAEVNHNYEREHAYNLWFVINAPDKKRLVSVMDEISARTGIAVMDLPMEKNFHIDLGFELKWK